MADESPDASRCRWPICAVRHAGDGLALRRAGNGTADDAPISISSQPTPRRAMRCTPRSMSTALRRADLAAGWRASPCTARHRDRRTYLLRPDLGRRLRDADREALPAMPGAMSFVIAEDFPPRGAAPRAPCCSAHVIPRCSAQDSLAPVVLAEQGRVALGDDIGEAMGAEAVAVLIGERPALPPPTASASI